MNKPLKIKPQHLIIKELTDNELNIAICEWMGWTRSKIYAGAWGSEGGKRTYVLPDYINGVHCRNNIHEALCKLSDNESLKVMEILDVEAGGELTLSEYANSANQYAFWCLLTAPRILVKAILKTVRPELFK